MRKQEKRRSERARHDSVFELYDEDGGLIGGNTRLVDISSVGAKFASTAALFQGEHVRGRLRLLQTGALDVAGRIVRIKTGGNATLYGLDFDQEITVGSS